MNKSQDNKEGVATNNHVIETNNLGVLPNYCKVLRISDVSFIQEIETIYVLSQAKNINKLKKLSLTSKSLQSFIVYYLGK